MNQPLSLRFWSELRAAALMLLVMTILTGMLYPLVMTGVAQVLFPRRANGSLVTAGDRLVGSELIGQGFSSDKYFQPRPSAAGKDGYDAPASSGSNLGPTNKALIDAVSDRVDAYRKANGLGRNDPVPVDAVTASASGLDPHISPANAALQVKRVAQARHIPESQVRDLLARHTEGPQWLIFGEPRVNVLKLNLALDQGGR